jgi:hypothetical protein
VGKTSQCAETIGTSRSLSGGGPGELAGSGGCTLVGGELAGGGEGQFGPILE